MPSMTAWIEMPVGDVREVDDGGSTVQVVHQEDALFIVRRFYDGSWNDCVWVRGGAWSDWAVAREAHVAGRRIDGLDEAITEAIKRSREAVNG
jgi:hypothetical protein